MKINVDFLDAFDTNERVFNTEVSIKNVYEKKNVDFIYVFDTNERVFSITKRHFDKS